MLASTWIGIGVSFLLVIVLGFAIYLFIYAEREFSKVQNWPLYSGFSQIGGRDVTLSCPANKKINLERATYEPFGNGSGCSECFGVDVTSELKQQTDGKQSITLQNIPTSGIWNGQRACASGESCSSGYVLSGSFSCL